MFSSSAAKAADYTPTWMRDKMKKAATVTAPATTPPATTPAATTTLTAQAPQQQQQQQHNNNNGVAAVPHASSISVTRTSSNTTSAVPWSSSPSTTLMTNTTAAHDRPAGAAVTATVTNSATLTHQALPPAAPHHTASPALGVTHTPTMMKRLPVRMSPMLMPSSRSHMNPNANEFVPGRGLVIPAATMATPGMAAATTPHSHNVTASAATTTTSSITTATAPSSAAAAAAAADLHHGLDILPSTTADMEAKQQQQHAAATTRSPAWLPQHKRSVASSPVMAPVSLEAKSEAEILEISKRSALSVTAAAYVPRRTMTRVVLSKPSPLTLTPSADPATAMAEMTLDDLWCLFYLPVQPGGKGVKEEDYNPLLVFRIDCIPTFWKVFNNVPTPSELQPSTLYLFRDGIDPKWEDAANRDGGIVKIKVNANDVDEAWEVLLCRSIGDSWSPAVRNTINGVALKVRERAYLLEVWVTRQTPDLMKDLAALLQPILGATFATTYYPHSVMQERAHAAHAAMAERQSKQQQQQRRRY